MYKTVNVINWDLQSSWAGCGQENLMLHNFPVQYNHISDYLQTLRNKKKSGTYFCEQGQLTIDGDHWFIFYYFVKGKTTISC